MGERDYLALIERARDALARRDAQLRENAALIEEMSTALAVKSENAELGAAIKAAGRWFDVAEAAKELAVEIAPGKRLGPNQLYAFLRNTSMVMRKRDPASGYWYHQPKQDQVDAGRMKLQERHDSQREVIYRKTLISASGLIYLSRKITEAMSEGVLGDLISE